MTDAKEGKLHEAFEVARNFLRDVNLQLGELTVAQVKAMDSGNRSLVDSLSIKIVELGPRFAAAIEAKAAAYKAWRG